MLGVKQTLYVGLSTAEVNEHLANGARIVYQHRTSEVGLWDVTLQTEEADHDPRVQVLDFLLNVDPGQLEKRMLDNPSMEDGVGMAAIKALADMLVPRGTEPAPDASP